MRFLWSVRRILGIILVACLGVVVTGAQLFSLATEAQQSGSPDPWQTILPASEAITLEKAGYTWRMSPRATYLITARVLRSQPYDDWQAQFVPVDVALGWGKVSDPAVDRWIDWWQEGRWYYYQRPRNAPLSQTYIREHSANVHLIPATETVAAALLQLKTNDMVIMEGLLVDVEAGRDGQMQQFYTSLTRLDEGDSSCEILYVERLVMNEQEYR